MKYVIIQTGGKQYRASEGDILEVEFLSGEKNQKLTFAEVLLYTNEGSTKIGTPFVSGVSVEAVILDQFRGEKIRVVKYKAKARTRRVTGHRQDLTRIKIESIVDGKEKKKEPVQEVTENQSTVSAETSATKESTTKKTTKKSSETAKK